MLLVSAKHVLERFKFKLKFKARRYDASLEALEPHKLRSHSGTQEDGFLSGGVRVGDWEIGSLKMEDGCLEIACLKMRVCMGCLKNVFISEIL